MDKELKQPKSYSLDPIVVAWVAREAALRKIAGDDNVSDSGVVNEILRDAMERSAADEDADHLQKMARKYILRRK